MPAFDLTAHLSRSAEQTAWDLTAHLKKRQPIEVLRSTCAVLRRPLSNERAFRRAV